jgi:hypothetical protein
VRGWRLYCQYDGRNKGVRSVPDAPRICSGRHQEGLVLMVCVMIILVLPLSREGFAVIVTMTDYCLLLGSVMIAPSAVSMVAAPSPNLPL